VTLPTIKVEVGFDLTSSPIGPFFRLDDPVAGVLDNTSYLLGGTIFYDITSRVRRLDVGRGRDRDSSETPSGVAAIEFNNHDRAFDPLYTSSPFYGNIVPRREIRISAAGEYVFTGWIDDWDLSYTANGDSIAIAKAIDATSIIAGQYLSGLTPPEELSGTRINRILDLPEVDWATDRRDVDNGQAFLGAYPIEAGTNALEYINRVSRSEFGMFFIAKNGDAAFRDRAKAPSSIGVTEFNPNGGIPFNNVNVVYGSELLYNRVVFSRVTGGTALAENATSQGAYGIRSLEEGDFLVSNDTQVTDYANYYVSKYSNPEYRFESVEVVLEKLTTPQQDEVLALELGSVVKLTFLPNGIAPAIEKYLEVIRIGHQVTPFNHYVTLGFAAVESFALVLDDPAFGMLDVAGLGF
jgi:hypothetical protein